MKKFVWFLAVLAILFSVVSEVNAELLSLIPPPPDDELFPPSGPFGFGGRGVVFRAEEDFTMSAFEMEATWEGQLDFAVEVYEVVGTSRGDLLSSTEYPALSSGPDPFLSLAHIHAFKQGQIYEIMMRFSDPGVIFPHYNFNNPGLLPEQGFLVGSKLLVLDGSDFDRAGFSNTWLANFRLETTEEYSVINGKVIDKDTNEPLRALVIALQKPIRHGTISDSEGKYEIPELTPGDWWVLCLKGGYKFALKKVTLAPGDTKTVDFMLEQKPEGDLDEISLDEIPAE